jgi:hypothetical protein
MPMSQTPEERSGQSATAVERAEELISRVEQRIGSFTALVGQRTQQTTTRISEQVKQARTTQGETPNQQESAQAAEPNQPAMEKADKVVGDMGQRLNLVATIASLQSRKITARVREDAEDMWAEIQQIRNGRGVKHQ